MSAALLAEAAKPEAFADLLRVPEMPGFEHLPVIGRPHVGAEEIICAIRAEIDGHERSAQVAIGPSEIGHPCDRWILHKLNGRRAPRTNIPWKATVGTALHTWLEGVIQRENARLDQIKTGDVPYILGGPATRLIMPRYLTETKVMVGTIGGREITGHCDLFDTETYAVWDWKTTAKTKMTEYRRHGPSPQYRIQAHTYGRGWQLLGWPVTSVGNIYLMRDGELRDTHVWYEPYDETVATAALARCDALAEQLSLFGLDLALTLHPQLCEDDYCGWCRRERPRPTTAAQLFNL